MRYRHDPCVAHVAEWIKVRGSDLHARFDEAERFLHALESAATSFSFRTFSDTPYTRQPGKDPLERALHGSLRDCWEPLLELNHRGAAVSVTINRSNGRGREVADIEQVRALFVDDDNPPDNLDRFPLPPHIQVRTSPGHFHHYWLVEGLPLERFSEMQSRLACCYGGDNKVMALNQSMQLPGIWRRKNLTAPRLPTLIRTLEARPYHAWAWRKLFEGSPNEASGKSRKRAGICMAGE